MIFKEIQALKQQISVKTKINCYIGNDDYGPDDYPLITIIPDQAFVIFKKNNAHTFDFPVTLKTIVSRKNEADALDVLERLMCALDDYGRCPGHEISEDGGGAEYTANTYELKIIYNLKLRQIGE